MRYFLCAHQGGGCNYVLGNQESREEAVEAIRRIYHSGFLFPGVHSVSIHFDHPANKTSKMLVIASPVTFWERNAA